MTRCGPQPPNWDEEVKEARARRRAMGQVVDVFVVLLLIVVAYEIFVAALGLSADSRPASPPTLPTCLAPSALVQIGDVDPAPTGAP